MAGHYIWQTASSDDIERCTCRRTTRRRPAFAARDTGRNDGPDVEVRWWVMTLERLVDLIIRSLSVEYEIQTVDRGHTSLVDHALVVVTDRRGGRWRLTASPEAWSRPS